MRGTFAKLALFFFSMAASHAQSIYSWTSATSGGSWETQSDWTLLSGSGSVGFPRNGDTADLGNAVTNRVITYDEIAAGAPPYGVINALNFTQTTANVTNELDLEYGLAVGNPLSVSATHGTSEIYLDAPSIGSEAVELIPQTQLTIGAGGNVTISGYSSVVNSLNEAGAIGGPVTINGGVLDLQKGLSGNRTFFGATSSLNLQAGSVTFAGGSGASTDNELVVAGTFSMSGGKVSGGSLDLEGGTTTLTGGALSGTAINLFNSQGQSLTSSIALGNVGIAGSFTSATTITDTATGPNIGAITFAQNPFSTVSGDGSLLRLGSNLTASDQVTAATQSGGSAFEFIDLNGHQLDLTEASANFTPNNAGSAQTTWTIESTQGSGQIRATGFTLSGSQVSIGANVTLEATGATANDLGGPGTIDPGSSFTYSGSGTATLVSNRTIGSLIVENGTLNIFQASLAAGGPVEVMQGGTLKLNSGTGGSLSLGFGDGFQVNNGTLDLTLGSTFDRIIGAQGEFILNGLTLDVVEGSGFSTDNSYAVFQDFSGGTALTGVTTNIAGYDADISNAGVVTFVEAPEPGTEALLVLALVGLSLPGLRLHRRPTY